ncbi:MAG TPA: hypothetical protein VKS79_04280 [Gemmataceae bacterium]|nr:hypothetical protein [Gemmataceae bacterium]
MYSLILLADSEPLAGAIAFSVICISIAAHFISVQWREAKQAQVEVDLNRKNRPVRI